MGFIAGDKARLFKALDALQAGAGRKSHGIGEINVADTAIFLQLHQDVDIDAVKFH